MPGFCHGDSIQKLGSSFDPNQILIENLENISKIT